MNGDVMKILDEVDCHLKLVSNSIDFILLGVAEEEHIPSLFPNNLTLAEIKRNVLPSYGFKSFIDR